MTRILNDMQTHILQTGGVPKYANTNKKQKNKNEYFLLISKLQQFRVIGELF